MTIQENPVIFCSEHDQVWENTKGKYHREDGPSVIYSNGVQYW